MKLRDLPSVDELARGSDDPLAVEAARAVLARAREDIQAGAIRALSRNVFGKSSPRPGARGFGVSSTRPASSSTRTSAVRHSPEAALERVHEVGRGYSNLEYDLTPATRGSRQDHVAGILRRLTGAEAALVVNNNAAAVLLALAALAEGRDCSCRAAS